MSNFRCNYSNRPANGCIYGAAKSPLVVDKRSGSHCRLNPPQPEHHIKSFQNNFTKLPFNSSSRLDSIFKTSQSLTMKFFITILSLTAMACSTTALPQRGGNRQGGNSDRQALINLAGTSVDPGLENGTVLLSNGQGQCVAVSGRAVCSDSSGATL